jgi:hypothetical protein
MSQMSCSAANDARICRVGALFARNEEAARRGSIHSRTSYSDTRRPRGEDLEVINVAARLLKRTLEALRATNGAILVDDVLASDDQPTARSKHG